jgi:hypothetical protein
MLRPANRPVGRRQVLDAFVNMYHSIGEDDAAFDAQLRCRQQGIHRDLVGVRVDREPSGGHLSMHRQASGRFVGGRSAKDVETQVVAHDAGEQRCVRAAAILRVACRVVGRRLDRRPRRDPQGVDARLLIEDLGDVASFVKDREAQRVVLDRGRPPSAKHRHTIPVLVKT